MVESFIKTIIIQSDNKTQICGPIDQPGRSPALQAGGLGFKSRSVHPFFWSQFYCLILGFEPCTKKVGVIDIFFFRWSLRFFKFNKYIKENLNPLVSNPDRSTQSFFYILLIIFKKDWEIQIFQILQILQTKSKIQLLKKPNDQT